MLGDESTTCGFAACSAERLRSCELIKKAAFLGPQVVESTRAKNRKINEFHSFCLAFPSPHVFPNLARAAWKAISFYAARAEEIREAQISRKGGAFSHSMGAKPNPELRGCYFGH